MRSRSGIPLAVALAVAPLTAPAHAQSSDATLYQRLGGYDEIASVVDDFMERFDADAVLATYLGGVNAAAGRRIRQHFVDFFCERTGGPCLYNGMDMATTHEGLNIPPEHFDIVIGHMGDALDAHGVATGEREEVLAMMRGLETQVVGL